MTELRPSGGRGPLLRVFLFAFILFAYFMPQWADWNIDSRLDLVHAIVDGHTLRIDRYHWNTWDKAVFKGHYYSDKAPGTAVLGAVVYAAYVGARSAPLLGDGIRALERNSAWNLPIQLGQSGTQNAPAPKGTNLGGCQRTGIVHNVQYIPWGNRLVPPMQDWALSKYVVTAGSVGLVSAIFAAFLFWFLGFFTLVMWQRWLLTGLASFATVSLPYSTNFYSHELSAAMLFVAFALIFLRARRGAAAWTAPVAGFLLGFAFFTEYTVALIIPLIGLYAVWALRREPRSIVLLGGAACVPVIALFAYNYACFGNPLDTGYSHDYCWSSAQAAGFAGFTYPKLGPLFDLTFGSYRGLFYLSPFLLLAAPGAWLMARRTYPLESALCLAIGVLFILALSAYWGWNGGRTIGPRYLVPVVPFLALPVIFILDVVNRARVAVILVFGTAAWSVFVVWTEFLGGHIMPLSWLRDPIPQYSLPALSSNQIAPNAGLFLGLSGWQSLLPLAVLLLIVGLWPGSAAPVSVVRLRAAPNT